jgi:hypothetical protein
MYRIRLAERPDKVYLISGSGRDVLEAGRAMEPFIDGLELFVPKVKCEFNGWQYSCGDFIVRTGTLSVTGLQQNAVLVEVEYTPCSNLIAAAPILHEFIENLIVSIAALTSLPPLSTITVPLPTTSTTTSTSTSTTSSPPSTPTNTSSTTTAGTVAPSPSPPPGATSSSTSSSSSSSSSTAALPAVGIKVAVGSECSTLQQFGLSMHHYSARHTAVQYALVASQKQSTSAATTAAQGSAAISAAAAATTATAVAQGVTARGGTIIVGGVALGSTSTLISGGAAHHSNTSHSVRTERDLPMT